jgi:hypothetical protein
MELWELSRYSDSVADQLRLITKELNCEILGNQRAMYEAVNALITQNVLVKFSNITIKQNIILLPTYVLYKMLLLPSIPNQASNTEKLVTMQLWSCRHLKALLW